MGLTLLFMLIFSLRISDVLLNPQFWAEDGSIFFRENRCAGTAAIGKTYAGYYHLIPRLIAFVAGWFRPLHAPAIYIGAALTLTAVVLYLVQSPRLPLPFVPLLALAIALIPSGLETFGNPTNIQWFLAVGVVTILLLRPSQSKILIWLETAFVVIAGLTGPFVLLLLPVFAGKLLLEWKNLTTRNRMLILTAAAEIVASVQVYALVHNPATTGNPDTTTDLSDIPLIAGAALFNHTFSPVSNVIDPFVGGSSTTAGLLGLAEVGILLLVVVVPSLRTSELRFERLALLYFGSVVFLATLYKFKDSMFSLVPQIGGPRYFLIPAIVASWLMLSAWREPKIGFLAKISIGLLLISALVGFKRAPLINYDWPSWAAKLEAGKTPRIPINPKSWFVETDCKIPQ